MRNVALTAIALTFAGSAYAADLPAKAPPMVAPAAPSWTGFYIGGNVGYLINHNSSGETNFTQPAAVVSTPQAITPSESAFTGGGQIGYNWQFAPSWVLGFEGDWNWTNPKNSFCRTTDAGPPCTDLGRGFETISDKTDWLATARARVGYVWSSVLFYGTGGVAWGKVETTLSASCLVAGCGNNATANATSASFNNTRSGWVAGAGAEAMLTPNWTARIEWLHYDLGQLTNAYVAPAAFGSYGVSYTRTLQYDAVRFGVNYKFGWM
jgi:outer membrane immunogenic protein